jgi:hypothetical protein
VLIAVLAGIAWQHRSTFRQSLPAGTTGPSVVHEPLQPIPISAPSGTSVEWVAEPSDGTRILTPVPGGVEMELVQSDYDEWQDVPILAPTPSVVLRGDVQFAAGGSDNAIGFGCQDDLTRAQIGFHVHDDRTWTLVYFPPGHGSSVDVDSGYSSAIRRTSQVNSLTVSCVNQTFPSEGTRVMAVVNGVPVVDDLVGVSATGLVPTIDQCSCEGVDTGRFTNISLFSN